MDSYLIKKSLVNYAENCKRKGLLEDHVCALESKQYGPSGSGIVKMPDGNPPDRSEVITSRMMDIDSLKKQIEHFDYEIKIANDMMYSMSGKDFELLYAKYVKRMTYDELYKEFHYSRMQIHRIINGCIKNYLIAIVTPS